MTDPTAGPTYRQDPPFLLGEREMLEAWLRYHRQTLRWKCEGLSPEQLRERSVPPSSLSLHGLVRHMADVERNWFRVVLDGQDVPGLFWTPDDEEADFDGVDAAEFAADAAAWEAEIDEADRVTATRQLDDTGVRRGHPCSLRWVYVHMIEEYARHNGHADLLRERIDGATGD